MTQTKSDCMKNNKHLTWKSISSKLREKDIMLIYVSVGKIDCARSFFLFLVIICSAKEMMLFSFHLLSRYCLSKCKNYIECKTM